MSIETTITTFNLKLKETIRKDFKKTTHNRGTTMQAVLSAFTETYIESPDKFIIKMEINNGD
jgi:hypothetical protein